MDEVNFKIPFLPLRILIVKLKSGSAWVMLLIMGSPQGRGQFVVFVVATQEVCGKICAGCRELSTSTLMFLNTIIPSHQSISRLLSS